MSASGKPTPPDFDEDYLQAIAKWRETNKIKDDDTILVLMELFRIHQNHWDEIRHRQMPSPDERLQGRKDLFVRQVSGGPEEDQRVRCGQSHASPTVCCVFPTLP